MKFDLKWKVVFILAVAAFFIWRAWPPEEKISLGLDLKGGIHLRLEVQTEDAVRAETDIYLDRAKEVLTEEGIAFGSVIRTETDTFEISGVQDASEESFRKVIEDNFGGWDVDYTDDGCSVKWKPLQRKDIEEGAVRAALETISRRVNEYGVAEPTIQREGMSGSRILIQLPGVEDPERVKALIKDTAFLEYKLLAGIPMGSEKDVIGQYPDGKLPDDAVICKDESGEVYYPLKKSSVVTGRELKNAGVTQDRFGANAVSFTLDAEGTKKISKVSGDNVGERMAVVLDNVVITAPRIEDRLSSQSIITGSFTLEEAQDLSLKLRAGALPAGIKYLEERTVGPSLGIDSIRQGVSAAILGFVLVVIFMMFIYRISGINAVAALLLNCLIILGALATLGATLTLPGIAGYVLSIGMAVDANIIIFERIKEELRAGKTPRSAVDGGFAKALSAVVDSNLTTIIAAIFLFQFGTGPIKGFAVTLIIGIAANMFTALFVSKTIFQMVLGRPGKRVVKISI